MRTLPSSRRDVMRAIAVLSVASVPTLAFATPPLICSPAHGKGDRHAWEAAAADYQAALSAETAHPFGHTLRSHPEFERINAEHDVIMATRCRSLDTVMECPVPDHAALVEKLEIMVKEFDPEGFTDCIIADVRSLGGEELA